MLVLSNEEIEGLLTMPECLAVLEEAYRDLAAAQAATSPRVDNLAPCGRDDAYYAFKHMGGLWPCALTRTSYSPGDRWGGAAGETAFGRRPLGGFDGTLQHPDG